MGGSISKNAQLLKFFAQQYPGIPRKRLVKMVYMSDLIARQYLDHPISDYEYLAYYYGPYPPEIPETIRELETLGLAWTRETEPTPDGDAAWKLLFDSGRRIAFDFSLGENEVLGYVVQNYLNMPMEELLYDVVYLTKPFKASERFGDLLRMDLANSEGKELVGFDLEAVIRAEQQAEAGNYITARQFFDGLRTSIAARHG
ncbi:MAG TPA: Panacea domain-containing protein [Gemmatimonadales bacterium]|nr:Panacea domain-containing protein [Gemmatimonadales bacterium]